MPRSEREYPQSESPNAKLGLGRFLVEGDPGSASPGHRSRRKAFGASVAIESLLVALLVVTPLLTGVAKPQIRQLLPPDEIFVAPRREQSPVRQVATPTVVHRPTLADPFLHFTPPRPISNAGPKEGPGDVPTGDGDFRGISVSGMDLLEDVTKSRLPVDPPHVVPPPQQQKHAVKLSEGVVSAQLISRVEPRYPPLGRQMHQSGTVVLHAMISRDGRIESLEVVSGSPFFVQAALDAVRQWRYRPTLLDGEPVEVETTITVEFRLQH